MNKKTISLLAMGALVGLAGLKTTTSISAQSAMANSRVSQQNVQQPKYQGTIKVVEQTGQKANEVGEAKSLVHLAKITANQAKRFAERKIGGKATSAELGNENGSLVYEVKISQKETKVDAGNGKILRVEKGEADEGVRAGEMD